MSNLVALHVVAQSPPAGPVPPPCPRLAPTQGSLPFAASLNSLNSDPVVTVGREGKAWHLYLYGGYIGYCVATPSLT